MMRRFWALVAFLLLLPTLAVAQSGVPRPGYLDFRAGFQPLGGGSGPAVFSGAWFDDFSAGTGSPTPVAGASLNGRVINGRTWVGFPGAVANTGALTFSSSLPGMQGATLNTVMGGVDIPAPVSDSYWITQRNRTDAASVMEKSAFFLTHTDGSNLWSAIGLGSATPSNITTGNAYKFTYWNNSAAASPTTAGGVTSTYATSIYFRPGDTARHYIRKVAGNWTADTYHNGQLVGSDLNISAAGLPMPSTFGFYTGSTLKMAQFGVGDPATESMVSLEMPNRVVPTDVNGDITYNFYGDYTGAAGTGWTYTLWNATAWPYVALTNYTDKPIVNFSAAAGRFTGKSDKLLAANIPAQIVASVSRAVAGGSPAAVSFGPVQTAGKTGSFNGQIITNTYLKASASPVSLTGLNPWYVDGSFGDITASIPNKVDARIYQIPTNSTAGSTNPASFVKPYMTAMGITNYNIIRAGHGGETAYERGRVGSVPMVSLLQGIAWAGGYVSHFYEDGGSSDAQTTSAPGWYADYWQNMDFLYAQVDAVVGFTVPVTMQLFGANQTSTSPYATIFRRVEYNMAQSGGRYSLAVGNAHLSHLANDDAHLTNESGQEAMRLLALGGLDAELGGTTYKRGVQIISATKIDANTVDVVCEALNAADLAIFNDSGGTVGVWGPALGLNFGIWNGSTLSTALGGINPTSVSLTGSFTASRRTVRFVFTGSPASASNQFAVTGQLGMDPFNKNPTHDATIGNSGATNKDYWMDLAPALMAVYPSTAVVTATQLGTTLTVSAVTSGTLSVGDWLNWGTNRSILITALGTGTGGIGTYTVLASITQASPLTYTAAPPMTPIQPYFKTGGATDGSQDFVIST